MAAPSYGGPSPNNPGGRHYTTLRQLHSAMAAGAITDHVLYKLAELTFKIRLMATPAFLDQPSHLSARLWPHSVLLYSSTRLLSRDELSATLICYSHLELSHEHYYYYNEEEIRVTLSHRDVAGALYNLNKHVVSTGVSDCRQ